SEHDQPLCARTTWLGHGTVFRRVRRSHGMPVCRTRNACFVAPWWHRLSFSAAGRYRSRHGRALPDGPGYNATCADVILRENARPLVLDRCAVPNPFSTAPVRGTWQPNLLRVATATRAHCGNLGKPRHYDRDHGNGRPGARHQILTDLKDF